MVDVLSKRNMECPPQKCFRYGSEYRQVRFNEKVNLACNNSKYNDDHKIYASMAQMSSNDQRSSENYGDSSKLTNWILDS